MAQGFVVESMCHLLFRIIAGAVSRGIDYLVACGGESAILKFIEKCLIFLDQVLVYAYLPYFVSMLCLVVRRYYYGRLVDVLPGLALPLVLIGVSTLKHYSLS